MTPLYTFHILDPRPDAANPILDTPCMGVEVTVTALAARCTEGCVDPQHGEHYEPTHSGWESVWPPVEPGDSAASYALRVPLPPDGTTLVTVRSDVDAVASMGGILLRRLGLDVTHLPAWQARATYARVELIRSRDAFAPGAVWAPRPLPTIARPWSEGAGPVDSTESLAPLGIICSPSRDQPQLSLADRVYAVACWLLWGQPEGWPVPRSGRAESPNAWGDHETAASIHTACGATGAPGATYAHDLLRRAARLAYDGRLALARAVEGGDIRVSLACDCAAEMVGNASRAGVDVAPDRLGTMHLDTCDALYERRAVAVVVSEHPGALGIGYCVAPVVAARTAHPAQPHTMFVEDDGTREIVPYKATIAAWSSDRVDFPRLKAALNTAEAERWRRQWHGKQWGEIATWLSDFVGDHTRVAEERDETRSADGAFIVIPGLSRVAIDGWGEEVAAANAALTSQGFRYDELDPALMTIARRVASGWGGGAAILGSPQGTGTMLPWADVVRLVRAHLA